jgi:molybdate transport system substrate-binding protein
MKKIKVTIAMILFFWTVTILFSGPVAAAEINISMAASLKDAVTELSDAYAKKNPGIIFQKNSGASGAIAKQIESGAPADIFISANLEWMDYLKGKGIVEDKNVTVLAYNNLVVVGKPDLKIKALNDLVSLEKIAIGSPKSVPAGEYAMAALTKTGIDKQLETKLVMAKDVRECLMYAERGEVDAAFIYGSDTKGMSDKVKTLFIVPQDLYPKVTYPMGLTTTGAAKEEAKAFFKFLQTEEAKSILSKYGFIIE